MMYSSLTLWGALFVIGCATYLTRSLPFWTSPEHPLRRWLQRQNQVLIRLGPVLIAALTGVTLLPAGRDALLQGRLIIFVVAAVATIGLMRWRKDAGMAVLGAVLVYWLGCNFLE